MKLLQLTDGEVTVVDDNIFYALSHFTWRRDMTKTNSVITTSSIKGERRLHRIIMNAKKGEVVDHIDGNVLNNLKSNLRICTKLENSRNRKKNTHTRSPYKGVSWQPVIKTWIALIRVNNRLKHLGVFDTPEKAAKAYNKAAVHHFGVFAKLNQI